MDRWANLGCGMLAALTLVLITTGCDRAATREGEEGNLEFSYYPADDVRDFDRPLAVGSGMAITVEPAGDREFDAVRDVSVEPEGVLWAEIEEDEDDQIYVWADASGQAQLEVESFGGGEIYSDTVTLRADEVEQAVMQHQCTSQRHAAYVVGDAPTLLLERQNGDGDKLIGEAQSSSDAEFSCQVHMNPEDYQDRAFCDEAGLHFDTVNRLELIYVDLIGTVAAAGSSSPELDLDFIAAAELDFDYPDGKLRTGATRRIELNPITYGAGTSAWPVCTHLELYVEILTPSYCSASNGDLSFFVDADEENEIPLRGQNPGSCRFAVELADRPDLGDWIFSAEVQD